MEGKFYILIILNALLFTVEKVCVAQDCDSKDTCDQCIQELNCFWCNKPKIGSSHCFPRSELGSCNQKDTEDPAAFEKILQNDIISQSNPISPQRISLKLRKNEKHQINFRYMQNPNYPVDLYYIMDMSNSMRPSKNKLAELGEQLVEEMKKKTDDFLIGFGSFVDKLALPFVNTHKTAMKNPCKNSAEACAPPYSFKNHLSLSKDAQLFSRKVGETRMSGNMDTPEGGLDAIMQAIVCKTQIGWRPEARHLLVMSTDAVSHIAGDGKLGGVIEPNIGACRMQNDSYTDGLIYDYPSVSQINHFARKNNVILIFAIVVSKSHDNDYLISHYQAMSDVVENSRTGTLDNDAKNVIQFISEIYEEIKNSVKITSDAQNDVEVNVSSTCQSFSDKTCSNVHPGQILDFTATIEPLSCSADANSNKKIITIKPEGLQDSLIVELEVICDCSCAKHKEINHPSCNSTGDLECGICRCKHGTFGVNCHCDKSTSKGEDPKLCTKKGDREPCSGQGKCKCGICECNSKIDKAELIYGKYCECDNFSCPSKCSGKGTCDCGKCKCDIGWSGPDCSCSTDESRCMSKGSKTKCSGNGECKCGQCVCSTNKEQRYSGTYCEECTSCPAQRCAELAPCVECQAYNTGIYANSSKCAENCTIFNTNIVKSLEETSGDDIKKCRVVVEGECAMVFTYSYDENKDLVVTAEEHKRCPSPPPILAYTTSIIGTILLIGILTLILWKILTTIHDRREYAKFINESNRTQWGSTENPLYKPGTSHFQNPAYGRASQRISTVNTAQAAQ